MQISFITFLCVDTVSPVRYCQIYMENSAETNILPVCSTMMHRWSMLLASILILCLVPVIFYSIMLYLDIPIDADSWVIDTLQPFECHWTLLLIVDEEDNDPPCEIKQNTYCRSFTNATIRSAQSHTEKYNKKILE